MKYFLNGEGIASLTLIEEVLQLVEKVQIYERPLQIFCLDTTTVPPSMKIDFTCRCMEKWRQKK